MWTPDRGINGLRSDEVGLISGGAEQGVRGEEEEGSTRGSGECDGRVTNR